MDDNYINEELKKFDEKLAKEIEKNEQPTSNKSDHMKQLASFDEQLKRVDKKDSLDDMFDKLYKKLDNEKLEIAIKEDSLINKINFEYASIAIADRDKELWNEIKYQLSKPAYFINWPDNKYFKLLFDKFPNMLNILDDINNKISLSSLKKIDYVEFENILIIGDPSCGKSYFSTELAKALISNNILSPFVNT